MKLSVGVGGYGKDGVRGLLDFVRHAERLGVDYVWSAEAWGQDAVTTLGFLAGQTERIRLGTGIMQVSARVPAMIAMTAMSLQALSGGRFVLGLGASGPQVVEGLHGVAYHPPLARLRETVEIVKLATQGEKLAFEGRVYTLPRPGGEGKAIRLDQPPTNVPIFLATIAPRALEYTGAAADGWLGTSFSPDHAEAHFAHLRRGAERAGRSLADVELHAACQVGISDDVEGLIDARRAGVAFNMGGMGSRETNFYNDAFQRAGFEEDAKAIQALWFEGKRKEAAARVPDAMVTQFGALGTPEMVRERLRRYRDVGIDGLTLRLDSAGAGRRIELLEQIVDMVREL